MSNTEDRRDLRLALLTIRKAFPSAETAIFQSSDQDLYGFILDQVILADGCTLSSQGAAGIFGQLMDDVWCDVCNIRWNGVMGEDYGGRVSIDISSSLAATEELEGFCIGQVPSAEGHETLTVEIVQRDELSEINGNLIGGGAPAEVLVAGVRLKPADARQLAVFLALAADTIEHR